MAYTHLSQDERDMIAVLRGEGHTMRSIAKKMKRDPGTLSRELKRNAPPIHTGYYLPRKAHERAILRNQKSRQRERLKNPQIRDYVRTDEGRLVARANSRTLERVTSREPRQS